MSLTRTKPLDTLYDEVRDHDLVLVPDPALASALNRRLERPHFGPFATTPRRLAARRRETDEDRLAFLAVVERTDCDWRRAAEAVGDVLHCWEHECSAEAILAYEGYDTPTVRRVIETVTAVDTTTAMLEDYTVDTTAYPSVAVVDETSLTPLERTIVPAGATRVDRFTDETRPLPEIQLFDAPGAAVDAVLQAVSAETAGDVAVVLEADSEYAALLESGLEADDVPYYGGPGFTDDRDLQSFIALLRTLESGSSTRVGDVRPLLTHLGLEVPLEHEEKRLFAVEDPSLEWVRTVCLENPPETVGEALSRHEDALGRSLDHLRAELRQLGVLTAAPPAVVDDVVFYLETYEVPVDRENEGVLLANATSAAHVDRPVVVCLGLDDGWTHPAPTRPWVERGSAFERELAAFQAILQSGVERHLLAVDTAGGEPVTPTVYLDALREETLERFSELPSRSHGRPVPTRTARGFEPEPTQVEPDPVTSISQSSLNTFVNCPRDYLFGRLLKGPDKEYFAEGNWFHDFAEFHAAHPEVVNGPDGEPDLAVIEEVVDLLAGATEPFHRDIDAGVRRTRYRVGLETLTRFLNDLEPDEQAAVGLPPTDRWGTNVVAEYFGRPIESPLTERWFDDEERSIKGKIDLVASPTHLVDFKTGSRSSAAAVMRSATLDPPGDPPDYQALLYLTYLRKHRPDERLSFTFCHFLECLDEAVTGTPRLEDCLTTIEYRPVTYEEYVRSETVFEQLCEAAANACTKTFSKVDHDQFLAVLEETPVPRTRRDEEAVASPFCEALTDRLVDAVGDYKYVRTGTRQACKHLAGLRREAFFADDVDAFEDFVADHIDALNEYRAGKRFPIEGPGGEPNYRRVDHRDLLIEGEGQ